MKWYVGPTENFVSPPKTSCKEVKKEKKNLNSLSA